MSWFEALILGLVQGLTEFLPISSSAHLRLTALVAGWDDPGAAFTAVSQIGTEIAVLLYFRKDITRIVAAWSRSLFDRETRRHPDARAGWLVIIGSLPIGLLGVLFKDAIEGPFRDLRLIATTFIVFGLILGAADRLAAQAETGGRHRAAPPRKTMDQLTVRDGLCYGLFQALALIPGVSRSGATISGGLLMGYRREAAARYSFLLAVPAVLGAGVFELKEIGGAHTHLSWPPTLLATVVGGLVGYVVIAWFMRFISTRSFMPFVLYRIVIGVVLFALIGAGVLDPLAGDDIGG